MWPDLGCGGSVNINRDKSVMSIQTCLVVALGLLMFVPSSQAASIGITPGARIDVPLKSLKDLRDENKCVTTGLHQCLLAYHLV